MAVSTSCASGKTIPLLCMGIRKARKLANGCRKSRLRSTGAVKIVCHCEPVRTLAWQSVPLFTVFSLLFPRKSLR